MAKRPPVFVNPHADFDHARLAGVQQVGDENPRTLFGLISKGKTIGKRVNIAIAPSMFTVTQSTPTLNLLQIVGDDDKAQQLCITLLPPGIIPAAQFPGGVPPTNGSIQNATGDRSNASMYSNPVDYSWPMSIAIVEWGIGGVQSRVECDFFNGLVLNLCAAWVRVGVATDIQRFRLGNITGGALVLGAFVGPGYPKSNNAQRTFNVGEINNGLISFPDIGFNGIAASPSGGPNAFPIPPYAKQVTVTGITGAIQPNVDNTFDASIIFARDLDFTSLTGSRRFTSSLQDPATIPNGTFYWTVQNNDAARTIRDCSAVFDLAV